MRVEPMDAGGLTFGGMKRKKKMSEGYPPEVKYYLQMMEQLSKLNKWYRDEKNRMMAEVDKVEPFMIQYVSQLPKQLLTVTDADTDLGSPGRVRINATPKPVELHRDHLAMLFMRYMTEHFEMDDQEAALHAQNAAKFCWDNREKRVPKRILSRTYQQPTKKRKRAEVVFESLQGQM